MPTVRLSTTPAEIEMALKLRYEVFFLEGGDARYADHERQIWSDRDDGPQSHLLIAVDDSENVIGTVRLTILRDWQFIALEAYELDVLASHVGVALEELLPRIARLDRGAIALAYRGMGIMPLLQQRAEEVSLRHNCDVFIGSPGVENSRARRAYEKLGWKDYPVIGTYGGFTAQAIFKLLQTGSAQEPVDLSVKQPISDQADMVP